MSYPFSFMCVIFCLTLLFSSGLNAQILIKGSVHDKGSEIPIIGASVLVVGTYDGTISDANGNFEFTTQSQDDIIIEISYLGYVTKSISLNDYKNSALKIHLKASVAALDAVVVTASTFRAGDNSQVAVLKPMDILTTAGAVGDVMAALQTLPGTQANPEDGRLFVRGGDARETNIYVDGMKVFSPYTRTVGGSPSRGRFSPLLFGGVSFSTGGYSAAYGQALSGVLELEIDNDPVATQTNLNLMSLGANLGHTQRWGNHSVGINATYVNLSPYAALLPGRIDWQKPYQGFAGEAVYRFKTKKGGFKTYLAVDDTDMRLLRANIDTELLDTLGIRNRNLYGNTSYRTIISDKTSLFAGLSLGYNQDRFQRNSTPKKNHLNGIHARLSLKTIIQEQLIVSYGIDYLNERHQLILPNSEGALKLSHNRPYGAAFTEVNYFFSKQLAFKAGLRAEQQFDQGQVEWTPRLTLAQKIGRNAQISAAFGHFTQAVPQEWLLLNDQLKSENADHYLLNFNRKTDQQIIRAEAYYKRYDQLLKFTDPNDPATFFQNGEGYAYGLDFFWRANDVVKNVDCWVSYGWLEHQRDYRDFPKAATPNFSTAHNLSLVSKIWLPNLRSQLGLTFNYSSGRPYEDPNTPGFLEERSKPFRSLNLSWAYLIDPQKIIFFSASNLTGFRNEFGFEYGNTPDASGYFPGRVLRPNDDTFLFAGFFVTLSPDQAKNQLDNL